MAEEYIVAFHGLLTIVLGYLLNSWRFLPHATFIGFMLTLLLVWNVVILATKLGWITI